MKVLLLNGSPNEKGCTYTALSEVARTLEEEGIEAEIMHIKKNCIMGCTGCGACSGNGNRCIFDGGIVNEVQMCIRDRVKLHLVKVVVMHFF